MHVSSNPNDPNFGAFDPQKATNMNSGRLNRLNISHIFPNNIIFLSYLFPDWLVLLFGLFGFMFKQRQFSNVFYPGLLEGDNKPWPQSHEDRGNDQRCRFDLAGTPTLLEKEVAAWVYILILLLVPFSLCVCVKLFLSLWSLLLLILILSVIISLFITAYYTYIYI